MGFVKYPFGPATELAPAHVANHQITIENTLTIIKLAPTAAIEVDLIPAAGLDIGAEVILDVQQDATGRNVTLDAAIVAPDLVGVANDRDKIHLKWDGVAFVGGAWAKVVDAA